MKLKKGEPILVYNRVGGLNLCKGPQITPLSSRLGKC